MKRVNENKDYLHLLAWTPSRPQRQALFRTATKEQVLALSEILLNFLAGNIELSDTELKKLKLYKKEIRKAGTNKKIKWQQRKTAMIKVGKAIQSIVKAVIPDSKKQ